MEQEPVYVPSGKLAKACEDALARIYDIRQKAKELFVTEMTREYNDQVVKRNEKNWWRIKFFGRKPELYMTPHGMELEIKRQVDSVPPEAAQQHPMIQIHMQYGGLEDEIKAAMVMTEVTDSVPVSGNFCRGLSHLGVHMGSMKRMPFGFVAAKPDK